MFYRLSPKLHLVGLPLVLHLDLVRLQLLVHPVGRLELLLPPDDVELVTASTEWLGSRRLSRSRHTPIHPLANPHAHRKSHIQSYAYTVAVVGLCKFIYVSAVSFICAKSSERSFFWNAFAAEYWNFCTMTKRQLPTRWTWKRSNKMRGLLP
jgi:hypothetical protein